MNKDLPRYFQNSEVNLEEIPYANLASGERNPDWMSLEKLALKNLVEALEPLKVKGVKVWQLDTKLRKAFEEAKKQLAQ